MLSSFARLPKDYEAACDQENSLHRKRVEHRRFRFHRRVLRWQERSLWIALGRRALSWVLKSSLGSIGVFLLTFSAISLAGGIWRHAASITSGRLLLPIAILISSVPLLAASESCAEGIRRGRILSWLLFDFCGISEALFTGEKKGIERNWSSMFLGSLLGGIASLFHPLVAILLLLLPVVASLLLSVPELMAAGVCLALPFFNLFARPTVALLASLLICFLAWVGKAVSGKRQMGRTRTDRDVLAFALCYLLGGFSSAGGRSSLVAGALRCVLLLLSWFPVRSLLSSDRWRKRTLKGLCISSFVVSGYGILQYVSGKAELAWVDLSRFSDIGGRVTSVFDNPNILAVYLLLTVPIALGGCFAEERIVKKLICAGSLLSGSLCLLLTWSRGAWLGWMLAVLFFFLCYCRRSLGLLLASPIPLLTVLLWLPRSVLNRFGSIGNLSESSIRYRLYTWQGVRRMLSANPFGIGVGDSAFHAVFPAFAVSGTERVMHAHHLLLQIASELGIPALLLFFLLVWRLSRRTAEGMRRSFSHSTRATHLGIVGGLLGALVMGQFDHIWYHGGTFCLFWMLAATLLCLNERGENLHET